MTTEALIQSAIATAKAGDKAGAEKLLSKAVRDEPENARAWYLLSQVTGKKEKAVFCLEQVLKIQPDNFQAIQRLQKLENTTSAQKPKTNKQPGSTGDKASKIILGLLGGLLGLCAVCVICSISMSILVPDPLLENPAQAILPPAEQVVVGLTATSAALVPLPPPATLILPAETAIPSLTPIPKVAGNISVRREAYCIPTNTQQEFAIVTRVIDGDTIEVSIAGQEYTVRYIGMDTPETKDPSQPIQYMGPESEARNRELVEGKQVLLVKDVSETDPYNRLLRYVLIGGWGGEFVNYELVRQGYAQVTTYPPDVACEATFKQAQDMASLERLGFWAPTPFPTLTLAVRGAPPVIGSCACDGPDQNCGDFSTNDAAKAYYNYCKSLGFGDIFNLDGDNDGIACEDDQ